jgi:hypothetical protein
MLSNVIVLGEMNHRWWRVMIPRSLIRPDRARPIDQVIDYFGGHPRPAAMPPFRERPASARDDQQPQATRR